MEESYDLDTILVIGQIEWYFVLIDASKPKYSIYIYSICVDFSITRLAKFLIGQKVQLETLAQNFDFIYFKGRVH